MLIIDRATAHAALTVDQAIPLLRETMRAFSAGEVVQPLRTILRAPSTGPDAGQLLGTMPAYLPRLDGAGFGVKAMVLRPDNPQRGLDLHLGVVLVFDPATGQPAALIDASAVTAIRTPAVTAVATDLLAAPGAGDLGLLGSGVQARGHLAALAAVRSLRRVRVWTRNREHGEDFVHWAADRFAVSVELMPTVSAALDGADLVCTTLASRDPVVEVSHLAPGCHVNAVGASFADHREFSAAAVAVCTVVVDSRASAADESGDLLFARAEGLIGPDHVVAELGELLLNQHPGRTEPEEITMFKSLGLAVQDVVAGYAIAQACRDKGLGIDVEWN